MAQMSNKSQESPENLAARLREYCKLVNEHFPESLLQSLSFESVRQLLMDISRAEADLVQNRREEDLWARMIASLNSQLENARQLRKEWKERIGLLKKAAGSEKQAEELLLD